MECIFRIILTLFAILEMFVIFILSNFLAVVIINVVPIIIVGGVSGVSIIVIIAFCIIAIFQFPTNVCIALLAIFQPILLISVKAVRAQICLVTPHTLDVSPIVMHGKRQALSTCLLGVATRQGLQIYRSLIGNLVERMIFHVHPMIFVDGLPSDD